MVSALQITIEFIKNLFYSCLLSLCILLVLGGIFFALLEYEPTPEDSKYIERLEFITKDSLPSCKVLQKKHKDESYDIAVYHLSEYDFKKALKGVQSDLGFKPDPDLDFFDLTKKMLKKEHIEVKSLDFKYYKRGKRVGFQSPDIVVYQSSLYD